MICPNCGSRIPEEERGEFCPYCGSRLTGDRSKSSSSSFPQGFQYYKRKLSTSDTLSKSYDILRDNLGPIFIYWMIPVLMIIVLTFIQQYTLMEATAVFEETTDLSVMWDTMISVYTIIIPLSLINTIIQVIFIGGVVGMAKEAYQIGRTSYKTGFESIKKHPLGIIGASIIITLLVNVGLVLCLIPGILFCYWWLFAIPIIVIEGKNITDSLSSSKKFAKDNDTIKFTLVLVGVIILMNIIGSIISMIVSYLIAGEIFSFSADVIITPIITGLITLLGMSFIGICITVHYLKGRPESSKEPKEPRYETPPPPDLVN